MLHTFFPLNHSIIIQIEIIFFTGMARTTWNRPIIKINSTTMLTWSSLLPMDDVWLVESPSGLPRIAGQGTHGMVQHNEQLPCNAKNVRHILFIKNFNHFSRRWTFLNVFLRTKHKLHKMHCFRHLTLFQIGCQLLHYWFARDLPGNKMKQNRN